MVKTIRDYALVGGIVGRKFVVCDTIYEVLREYKNASANPSIECRTYNRDEPTKLVEESRIFLFVSFVQ